ncbi:MAG TPA: serine hydrolase domain-containing protein [Rhizomicrobium sp.]|nr:serine hydrolase domain-containing protein [Rhizomicrobium sp.]
MDKPATHKGFDEAKLAAVPAAMQGVVDAGDLSGMVTLVWRDGEEVKLNTIGKRDIEAGKPMTRDTLFRIASMTKPITSVAALMLMEEGKIRLDDPITKWLPEFADMKVLKDPKGPLHETYPAPRIITIEDLMTHRSGLAYGFTSSGPIGKAHEDILGSPLDNPKTPDQWLAALATLPLTYPPGRQLHYSHSTEVLGFLIGRVAGTTYRDFIMERILTPLGMKDTDFYVPKDKRDRAAVVYQQDQATGKLKPVPFPQYDSPPAYTAGGGGLISTLDDYLLFARMLLNKGELNGRRYITRETFELMTTNHLTEDQRQIPFLGMPMWSGLGFGLGLSVVMDPVKHEWMGAGSQGSFGWPGAFGTWWQADPRKNMILIFLIQNYTPLTPDMAGQAVTGARMGARVACPIFQKMVYGALTA